MDDANQAFRELSPEHEALAHRFFTEHLMPFSARLGDPPAMPALCDVMVHPMLDFLAATLVDHLVGEVEDREAALAIARTWAEVLPTIFLRYVQQRAEREFE